MMKEKLFLLPLFMTSISFGQTNSIEFRKQMIPYESAESVAKGIINYGPFGEGKGTFFSTADLTNSGKMDIILAGKDGLCVCFNETN